MGNIIFEPIALLLTVAYPVYSSYKCLEHADKHDGRSCLSKIALIVVRTNLFDHFHSKAMAHLLDYLRRNVRDRSYDGVAL